MTDFSHIVSPSIEYEATGAAPTKYQFAKAVGLKVDALKSLSAILFNDLDPARMGFGWWECFTELSTEHRILISDYLYKATDSICDNLIDAKIHFAEISRFQSALSDRYRDAVKVKDGMPQVEFPKYTRPSDDIDRYLLEAHTAGLFRALGSTLDCLAASLIGVLALPHPIVHASMPLVAGCVRSEKNHPGHLPKNVPTELLDLFSPSGIVNRPTGWLTWVNGYRNMLVHRARRLQYFQLLPTPTGITDLHGQPLLKSTPIQQLAKSPTCTDIEGFIKNGIDVLSEDAGITTAGMLRCVENLVDVVAAKLTRFWQSRKEDPLEVVQPSSQWSEATSSQGDPFEGFAPGQMPVEVDQIRSNHELITRMKSASLDGDRISFWKEAKR